VLRAIDALVPQAASRGLVLRTEIESCTALAEPRRLEQVVTNLVVNAIKYTDSGEIVVSCRRRDNHVEVAVRDTGIGISREDQRRLFVPFARLNRADAGPEGTGLGLAISKRLVEAMRGRLQVSSEPGAGSTFTIRLEAAGEA
jgi:signal transduction histidine kinase